MTTPAQHNAAIKPLTPVNYHLAQGYSRYRFRPLPALGRLRVNETERLYDAMQRLVCLSNSAWASESPNGVNQAGIMREITEAPQCRAFFRLCAHQW